MRAWGRNIKKIYKILIYHWSTFLQSLLHAEYIKFIYVVSMKMFVVVKKKLPLWVFSLDTISHTYQKLMYTHRYEVFSSDVVYTFYLYNKILNLSVFSQFIFVWIKTRTKYKKKALPVQKYTLWKFQILCIFKTCFTTFFLLSIVQIIDFLSLVNITFICMVDKLQHIISILKLIEWLEMVLKSTKQ